MGMSRKSATGAFICMENGVALKSSHSVLLSIGKKLPEAGSLIFMA
jgi:hypothetical protein